MTGSHDDHLKEQDSLIDGEACSLLYANRSLVLFQMNCFQESLNQMDIAVKSGYPEGLKGKLLKRRIACQEVLKKHPKETRSATERHPGSQSGGDHDEALEQETNPNNEMTKTFDNNNMNKDITSSECPSSRESDWKSDLQEEGLLFMHSNLSIFSGSIERGGGRGVTCRRDITADTVIMRENCYTWVLYSDFWRRFCYHCLKKIAFPSPVIVFPDKTGYDTTSSSAESSGNEDADHKINGKNMTNNSEKKQTIERPSRKDALCMTGHDTERNHIPSSFLCYPCVKCSQIRFCSLSCRNAATKYHDAECGFLNLLQDLDSECLLTLRVLLLQGIESFLSETSAEKKQSKKHSKTKCATPSKPHAARDVKQEGMKEASRQSDQSEASKVTQMSREEEIEPLEGFEGFNRLVFHPHLSREAEVTSLTKATFILAFYLERQVFKRMKEASHEEPLSILQLLAVRNQIDKQIRKCQVNSMHITCREIEIQEHYSSGDYSSSSPVQPTIRESRLSHRQTSSEHNPLKRPENISLVEERIGCATFTTLSFLNHSCDPNARVIKFEGRCMTLQSSRHIREGEEVFISYGLFSKYHTLSHRRRELFSTYRFLCCCPDCSRRVEPTFNALKCPDCQGPVLCLEDEETRHDFSNNVDGKHNTSEATLDNNGEDDGRKSRDIVVCNGIMLKDEKNLKKKAPPEATTSVNSSSSDVEGKKKETKHEEAKRQECLEEPELLLSLSSSPSSSSLSGMKCLDCRRAITDKERQEKDGVILSGSRLLSEGMDKLFLSSKAETVQDKKVILKECITSLKESVALLQKVLFKEHVQLSIAFEQLSLASKRSGLLKDSLTFAKESYSIVSTSMDEDVNLFNSLFKLLNCYRFAILQEKSGYAASKSKITAITEEQDALYSKVTTETKSCQEDREHQLDKNKNNHSNKCNICCDDKSSLEKEGESMLRVFRVMLDNLLPNQSLEKDFYERQLLPLTKLLKNIDKE